MSDDKKHEEHREPLSFWGTVGANVVGGIITGTVTGGIAMAIAAVSMARMVDRATERTMLSMRRENGELPPGS